MLNANSRIRQTISLAHLCLTDLQIIAAKTHPSSIKLMLDPPSHVYITALEKNPCVIKHIPENKQTSSMKMYAVTQNGFSIEHIKNPTPEERMAALKQDGHAHRLLQNPTHEETMQALTTSPDYIEHIEDPNEEMQLIAITHDIKLISKIKKPTEKVKLICVINGENRFLL